MAYFSSSDGNLTDVFLSDYELIDQAFGSFIFATGTNAAGQLGDNTSSGKSIPTQNIGGSNWILVRNSDRISAGIKSDGTLWTWGSNTYGGLGDNTLTDKSSPVQTVSGGTDWKTMHTGGSTLEGFCIAIKTNGTLWTWGNNFSGQLGDNSTTNRSSPVQTVAGGTDWKQVSTGSYFSAALKTNGTLWLWGSNSDGQLGDNTTTGKSSPVQTISGGSNWFRLSTSGGATTGYISAIKTDGTLWSWGANSLGQLGDNTTTVKSSPVQTIAGGNNWVQCSSGSITAGAIKRDGTLWLWGRGQVGMLGDGTTVSKSSPVQTIAGGNNWKQISTGTTQAAVKTDGTLWTWGSGTGGQIGDGTIGSKSSPVQVITAGTFWIQAGGGVNSIQMLGVF